jgi:glycosyltransferase involved in cell wall biosynthesis
VSCSDDSTLRRGSDPGRNVGHAGRIPILYLLTDEISSVLVTGQLGYLIERGFDVTVGTRRREPHDAPAPGTFDDGVVVEHVPFVREPSPFADFRALWATIRLIRRMRPRIVNASTPKAGLLGMLAAWMCRVPVRVYVVRGLRFETATGWRRHLFVSLERLAVRCANHVIFNSPSLMALGEAEGVIRAGRGEVLGAGSGNGIDVARFADDQLPSKAESRQHFGMPADARVIGFVGRFTKDKGIEDLIDVFESGFGDRDDVWLLLVGQFEQGDPVNARTRQAIETNAKIVVVPWLDHPGAAYRAMDVLAFPSYREGLPNVPLEAQLCGVPVVGYAATGTVDAVADGKVNTLVPVGATGRLAGALADRLSAATVDPAPRDWVGLHFDRTIIWHELDELLGCSLARACERDSPATEPEA